MKFQGIHNSMLICAGLVVALILTACGGGGGGGSSAGNVGALNIHLADAPGCGYNNVFVTVDHLEISTDGNSWKTIPLDSSVSQPIDLLSLRNGAVLTLARTELTEGTYQQVRLVLKANNGNYQPWLNAVVLAGNPSQFALTTPSGQQSGFKILNPITIKNGAAVDLVLDFNACKSVVAAGTSGQYLLKPVVTATTTVMSGTISGFALAGSEVSAYAEDTNTSYVSGTVIPGNSGSGQFNLGPIPDSSVPTGNLVDVVIVPPAISGQGAIVIQGVPVTAGSTTWLSPPDGKSPFNGTSATASTINTVSGKVWFLPNSNFKKYPAPFPGNASLPGIANVSASQTITSLARTYQIAATTSNFFTRFYSLSLASSGPWLGSYSKTLPLVLTEDTSGADAGIYSLVASDSMGPGPAQTINVSSGSSSVDFTLSK